MRPVPSAGKQVINTECGYTSAPLTSPSFLIHNNVFDVKKKKSNDYYSLLVTEKAQPPNIIHKWKSDFNLSDDHFREFFL